MNTSQQIQVQNWRREMAEIAHKLFIRRLVSGKSGNISVRIPWSTDILIKASGKSLEDVGEDDFLLVNSNGDVITGYGVPSIEIGFHRGIYCVRPDVQAIIHGHSAYATAYVMVTGHLPAVTVEAQLDLEKIGIVGYADPGSKELADNVTDVFNGGDMRAAILCDHGFITVGESLKMAYCRADALEENAKAAYIRDNLQRVYSV